MARHDQVVRLVHELDVLLHARGRCHRSLKRVLLLNVARCLVVLRALLV